MVTLLFGLVIRTSGCKERAIQEAVIASSPGESRAATVGTTKCLLGKRLGEKLAHSLIP